jgi:hypothetical protein
MYFCENCLFMSSQNNYNISAEILCPVRYHFAEILSGMCEVRKLSIDIVSTPLTQSFFSRLVDGKKEKIKFVIHGPKSTLIELKSLIEAIIKNHNG